MTIVRWIPSLRDYPFEAISTDVLERLRRSTNCASAAKEEGHIVLRLLEAFLQITGMSLRAPDIGTPSWTTMCRHFVGALYSPKFVRPGVVSAHKRARAFRRMALALGDCPWLVGLRIPDRTITAELQELAQGFEKIPLDEEKAWMWSGWRGRNKRGVQLFFPLLPIYRHCGREFTQHVHDALSAFFGSQAGSHRPWLGEFTHYFDEHSAPINASQFLNGDFVAAFFTGFMKFHFIHGHGRGCSVSTLTKEWKNFCFFFNGYLVGPAIARPIHPLPQPPVFNVPGRRTNISKTPEGFEVKTGLLTDVPLHLTDRDAIEALNAAIHADIETARQWATYASNDLWRRCCERKELSAKGIPSRVGRVGVNSGQHFRISRENPEALANAAATFQAYGVQLKRDTDIRKLYPAPLETTSFELGLPTREALLPFAALLVSEHPKITPVFLQYLEAFDEAGRRKGYIRTDAGWNLIGLKSRAGPDAAEQRILLTDRAREVVERVLDITAPLREFLRERKDQNWKRLFLEVAGLGFMPRPINFGASVNNAYARTKLQKDLEREMGCSSERAYAFAKRFSLRRLRASIGVATYLQTGGDLVAMAEALGHKRYRPDVMEHYLPGPIRSYFQERWIRQFQVGIIVEALQDSPHLLRASSFKNMEELTEFLENHRLKRDIAEDVGPPEGLPADRDRIAFGVNTTILTILLSIEKAVEASTTSCSGTAVYWASISRTLAGYIDTMRDRPDIRSSLDKARLLANAEAFASHVHG